MSNNKDSGVSVGQRIKHYRLKADLSQQELATILGYKSGTAISLIESGARGIDLQTFSKITEALGINSAMLLRENLDISDCFSNFTGALRADAELTKQDKDDVINFYNYVKSRKK